MKNKERVYQIIAVVIVIDQLIKLLVQKNMNLFQEIKIIPGFFSICYVENTGAAFSILEDATILLVILGAVFLVILDHYIKKEEKNLDKLSILSFGLIMGGIFGNLIDRIIYHSVIDFISFSFGKYHFPIFNIADIGITVGVGLLLLDMWKRRKEE